MLYNDKKHLVGGGVNLPEKTAGQWGSLQISFNSLLIVKLTEGHLNRQKWELPVVTTTKRGVNQSSN